MGLLDDAIREHLELKRRRGADPTEVAREQREALDPIFAGEQPAAGDQAVATSLDAGSEPALDGKTAGDAHSTDIEETAELDMQRILDDDAHGV